MSIREKLINVFQNKSLFRFTCFITSLFAYVVYLQVFSVVFEAIVILPWAGYIFVKDYIIEKKIKDVKYFKLALAFLFSCLLSALFNAKYNFVPNIILIYHSFICIFVLYGMHADSDKEKIKKEMFFIMKTTVAVVTILAIAGFILILFKDEIVITYNFFDLIKLDFSIGTLQDETQRRFSGMYINPNLLAIGSIVAITFSHTLLCKDGNFKNKMMLKTNIILIFCIVINFVALILSDSNASFIFLIVYIVMILFYKLVLSRGFKSKKQILKKSVMFLLIGLSIVIFLVGSKAIFQNDFSEIINSVTSTFSGKSFNDVDEAAWKFGRPNHDLKDGSGRKLLIKQGIEIFKKHSVVGIGGLNFIIYGEKYFENGLAFAKKVYGSLGLADLHNGYLMILVSYGVIGFTLFIVFLGSILKGLFVFLAKYVPDIKNSVFPNLFAIIIAYCVYSLFEITILSNFLFMVKFLWYILGYAMTYLLSYTENNEKKGLDSY